MGTPKLLLGVLCKEGLLIRRLLCELCKITTHGGRVW